MTSEESIKMYIKKFKESPVIPPEYVINRDEINGYDPNEEKGNFHFGNNHFDTDTNVGSKKESE